MSKITYNEMRTYIQDYVEFVQKERNRNNIPKFGRPSFYDQLFIFGSNAAFCTKKYGNKNRGKVN